MPVIIFLFWLIVLWSEGFLLASLLLSRKSEAALRLFLALPLAAFSTVLLVFLYTLVHLPLVFLTLAAGHLVLIGAFFGFVYQQRISVGIIQPAASQPLPTTRAWRTLLRIVCFILLSVQLFFSFSHAVILPTFFIDSLTNWTMRSKVSFYDHAIAFDPTEIRGIAKPQYPFLFHTLQITVNEGNTDWNDRSANSILFLLTLSSFAALFLILLKKKGFDTALAGITLITGIPLLSFHLSQGYGDITLVMYLCLSFVSLWMYCSERSQRWLMLSAVCMAAGVWTKSEGLIVGFLPWILLLIPDVLHFDTRKILRVPALTGIALSLLFPIFLLSRGMGLTPHSSDTHLEWHADALILALKGLLISGSMGVVWFVIVLGGLILLRLALAHDERIDRSAFPLGLWGIAALCIILFTYVCTPNAVFLVNGESYYRQLMIPACLLILWGILLFRPQSTQS